MTNPTLVLNEPTPLRIALDLTCALVAGGKFSFTETGNAGRADEMIRFMANLAQTMKVDTKMSSR